MPLFQYTAFTKTGTSITGTLDAGSRSDARTLLSARGLYPITIEPAQEARGLIARIKGLFQSRIQTDDIVFFTRQLAVLLKAGIPLLQAFELLIQQLEGPMATIAVHLKDTIKEGSALADALQAYPKVFSMTYVQLVRAGEASGKLEIILDRLTVYLERSAALRKKVTGALTMPAIQLVIAIAVVAMLLVVVIPELNQAFSKMDLTLPLTTRIMINLSNIIMAYWWLMLGSITAVAISIIMWYRTPAGRLAIDRLTLKLPLVGYLARMQAVVDFTRTLGMLLEAGVTLSHSLDIVTSIVSNTVLTSKLKGARDQIIKQGKIAVYLQETGLFPPIAIYLITTGEQSGSLDAMLLQVATYYEEQLNDYTDKLVEKLGPIMTVVVGAIVGVIVMAIAQPMMQLNQGLSKI
jgi:type II secretory pathway component PulF